MIFFIFSIFQLINTNEISNNFIFNSIKRTPIYTSFNVYAKISNDYNYRIIYNENSEYFFNENINSFCYFLNIPFIFAKIKFYRSNIYRNSVNLTLFQPVCCSL